MLLAHLDALSNIDIDWLAFNIYCCIFCCLAGFLCAICWI